MPKALSSITIFSPQSTKGSFTFAVLKSSSGKSLAEAVAAAFGFQPGKLAGVLDTRGSLFPFDTVCQAPDLFADGKYQLALEQQQKSQQQKRLAPGALQNVTVEQFVSAFRDFVASDGTLSKEAFTRCMRKLAKNEAPVEEIHCLFDQFDLDGNGILDPSEFVAGGVVLCGGDRDTKIRFSFEILDVDGNGVLDFDEIKQYMTSVFRIVQNSNPEAFRENSPEALAQVTAMAAMEFAEQGTHVLTFDQFRAWMLSSDDAPQAALDLNKIKHTTGVAELELEQVIDIMIDHANEDGTVDHAGFAQAIGEICRLTGKDFTRVSKQDLDLFFRAVDVDGNGTCDVDEIGSAFSVLCQGSRDERCMAAFHLFDADGDGFLDLEEMAKLLSSVFRVLFASTPQLEREIGCSANELGEITAQDALNTLDTNGDGKVSFSEFREWYTRPSVLPQQRQQPEEEDDEQWLNLNETRRLTGLGAYNPALVMEAFALVADDEGMVSNETFFDTMQRLMPRDLSRQDLRHARQVQTKLYNLYCEEDGRVDFSTLAIALAMLSGGSEDEKKRSIFDLMDLDGNGTIEREEFVRFMVATMQVLFATQPRVARELGVSPRELAVAVTEDCFAKFDENRDDKLSFAEFSTYWKEDGMADMGVAGGMRTRKRSLKEIREILALEQYTAEDLFGAIATSRELGGSVSREHFTKMFLALATHEREVAAGEELDFITREIYSLYDTFDTDRNGTVDFTELAVGLSLLCGGTHDARAEAAFRLFQSPDAQAGTITLKGMVDYLTVVFRTMAQVGGSEAQQHFAHGETPESLAVETAQAVFTEADLNQDGTLSFDEWRKFYNASQPTSQEVRNLVQRVHVPIHEIKQRTGLNRMLPEEVFEHFAHAANDDGELSRSAFVAVFERIAPLPHDARLHLCIDSLFDVLDEDGNDLVDFVELSTGLSVLAMGTKKDKLRSAFSLLDLDHSGTIDQEELERYCASVFRIMFGDEASRERVLGGRSVSEHARETAQEVMSSPHLQTPGQLTLEEFIQWIEAGEDEVAVVTDSQVGPSSDLSVAELGDILHLSQYPAQALFEHFAEYANKQRELSREQFTSAVASLGGGEAMSLKSELAANHLFDALDSNQDGTVDFHELSAGLTVFSSGSRDDKVRAAFLLYDVDGNGYIDFDEMVHYLTSVFKVTYLTQPQAVKALDVTPERLAYVTAKDIFAKEDLNGDGQLSFEEFKHWYTSSNDGEEEEEEQTPCAKVAHATGLDQMTPNEAFSLFVRFADTRTGRITRTGFVNALQTLQTAQKQGEHFMPACFKMFSLFDTDHDGTVDLEELSVGLAMMLNPSALINTSSLFDLFAQGKDYLTVEAVQSMLETVFTLQLASGDGESVQIARGSSARELAWATAESIVQEADANHDGRISRHEFQNFVEQTKSGSALVKLVHGAEEMMDLGGLDGLRRLLGVETLDAVQVLQRASAITKNGTVEVDAQEFYALLREFAPTSTTADMLRLISQRLFEALDVDLSNTLNENELHAGLSVLCRGNKQTRASDAFAMYDLDGDGYVSLDELFFYLRTLFRVLKVADADRYAHVQVDDLAFETANQILIDADASGDGKISLQEFLQWTEAGHEVDPVLRAGGVATLQEARQLLGLESVQAEELFEALAVEADDEGEISREGFFKALLSFTPPKAMVRPMLTLLFDVLDTNGNGKLDFCEVASGMSILVGGEKLAKVRAACQLFDADGDGYITREEMTAYLTSVFAVILATHQDAAQRLGHGIDPQTLAQATCDEAFLTADLDQDGKLDYNEFAAWILADEGGLAVHNLIDKPPKLTLEEIRTQTGLALVSPEEMFEELSFAADHDGYISRSAFHRAFQAFAREHPSQVSDVKIVVNRLFDLLDVNSDEQVSLSELAAGLSVLCRGTKREKTRVAFDAFDSTGEERLDFEQVTLLLQSVFRLLLATLTTEEGGNTAEELAFGTAEQCFAEKDAAQTGFVSLQDFHDYFEHELGF